MMLYIGFAAVLLGGIASFWTAVSTARIRTTAANDVAMAGTFFFAQMGIDVRNAESIVLPYGGASGETLSLNMQDGSSVVYERFGNRIFRTVNAGVPAFTHSARIEARALRFSHIARQAGPGMVRAVATFAHGSADDPAEYRFETEFSGSFTIP
jgi:hypothetical protein